VLKRAVPPDNWSSEISSSRTYFKFDTVYISHTWASAEIFPGGQRRHFAYHFQVADVSMQMEVHKLFTVSTRQRKCLKKARVPFAYILKSYSNGGVHYFAAKVYFL